MRKDGNKLTGEEATELCCFLFFFLKHMIHNVSEISRLLSNKDEQGSSRTSLQPSD